MSSLHTCSGVGGTDYSTLTRVSLRAYPRYRCLSSMHTECYDTNKDKALVFILSLRPLRVAAARRDVPPAA